MGSNRSFASNAEGGKRKAHITQTILRKMTCRLGAKSVHTKLPTSLTSQGVWVREGISDMKTVIGSSRGSSRSFAECAKAGKARASFTKIGYGKAA
jgi:hypothetical protein